MTSLEPIRQIAQDLRRKSRSEWLTIVMRYSSGASVQLMNKLSPMVFLCTSILGPSKQNACETPLIASKKFEITQSKITSLISMLSFDSHVAISGMKKVDLKVSVHVNNCTFVSF